MTATIDNSLLVAAGSVSATTVMADQANDDFLQGLFLYLGEYATGIGSLGVIVTVTTAFFFKWRADRRAEIKFDQEQVDRAKNK